MAARRTTSRKTAGSANRQTKGSTRAGAAIGAAVLGAGALALGWWLKNSRGGIFGSSLPQGHPAPDLALDADPDTPVPDHFRPEGDAPVPKADRGLFAPLFARRDRQLGDDLVETTDSSIH